jgi:NAD(P)-dependent dehydrogenase (short-subunit alcohol dehydrogenase family)/acyl carrier protein
MTHTASESKTRSTPSRGASVVSPDLLARVQQVFADVTRYPIEILEPDASIEEDLGIDSVKLGEIFAALRSKYHLPPADQMKEQLTPERLGTIAGVAAVVAEMGTADLPPAVAETAAPAPDAAGKPAEADTTSPAAVLEEVRGIFAEVTRYPVDILETDADLEEELGIDSVKLGEIVAALRKRYALPPPEELQQRFPPERMRTIAGVAAVVSEVAATKSPRPSGARATPATVEEGPAVPVGRASGVAHQVEPKGRPFEGKIVLVTGSGHGLGKALACHLADLGATVVINSFHSRQRGEATAEEIVAAGGSAVHIWASVANDAQRDSLFDEIESRFGTLDFFVSSASDGTLARMEDVTPNDWEKSFRTNVIGLHQSALRAAQLMKRSGGGKIVTLSMIPTDRYLPYAGCQATVKAGVETLTRYLAVEFAPLNIQVNCVKAGAVYGELLEKWPESGTLIPEWEARTPAGRLCHPEEVAAMVAAVLRDELKFMTGSTIVIDGGHSLRL